MTGVSDALPPYSDYKDSGVPWLGRIPSHWDMRKMKYVFAERAQKGFPDEPLLAATQTKGVIPKGDYESRTVVAQKDLHLLKLVEAGDFVISLRSFQGGIEYAHYRGIISPAYTILKPSKQTHAGYLQFLLKSRSFVDGLTLHITGIREGQNIDYGRLSRTQLPIPSADEQQAIVRFLGHKSVEMQRFIRNKQRLIAALNEQKQTIINQAVTRGLDANAPLKPSGVPWLGDVPAHWEVRRIKSISTMQRGKFAHRPRNDPRMYDGPYPFIQTGEVSRANKHITSYRQTLSEDGFAVSKIFTRNTLLMTIAANIGDVAFLGFDSCVPDSLVGFSPHTNVVPDYFYYGLKCLKNEFLREAPVNTQGNLNYDRIGVFSIPLPPIEEQRMIVQEIEKSVCELDIGVGQAQREIALMREYRARLIADAVTGQVDVRAAAAALPAVDNIADAELTALTDTLDENETSGDGVASEPDVEMSEEAMPDG